MWVNEIQWQCQNGKSLYKNFCSVIMFLSKSNLDSSFLTAFDICSLLHLAVCNYDRKLNMIIVS